MTSNPAGTFQDVEAFLKANQGAELVLKYDGEQYIITGQNTDRPVHVRGSTLENAWESLATTIPVPTARSGTTGTGTTGMWGDDPAPNSG